MSTHPQLKDLLEQAAETVPPAEVPRDTWHRGRRRHRRSLALRGPSGLDRPLRPDFRV